MQSILNQIVKTEEELTFPRIAIALFSVVLFFVVPCAIINNYQNSIKKPVAEEQNQTTNARVAGVSTDTEQKSSAESLNSQSGLFIIVGLILFSVASILVVYLLMDKTKYRKFKY